MNDLNYKKDKVYTICYNRLDVFNDKNEARKFYIECCYMSDGAEHERYASILFDLYSSNVGSDKVSNICKEVSVKLGNYNDKFLNIKLNKYLFAEGAIKYYEEKIQPVLEVSDDYGVDFNREIPFEDFGSDADSYKMSSFSNYYKELLEKFNINVDNIYTDDRSDGKYKLVVYNQEFDITAWDDIRSVIDNVEAMIELSKNNDLEIGV